MDGTLLDTEGPARAAFAKAIVEVGFEFNAFVYDRCLGTTFAETKDILVAAYGKGLDTEELQRAWTANFSLSEIPRRSSCDPASPNCCSV